MAFHSFVTTRRADKYSNQDDGKENNANSQYPPQRFKVFVVLNGRTVGVLLHKFVRLVQIQGCYDFVAVSVVALQII